MIGQKRYGSLQDGLAKLEKMSPKLKERVCAAQCFLNLNQVWDYYQRRGEEETIRQIEEDEQNFLTDRKHNDANLVYACGHLHQSFTEAQLCFKWKVIAAGDRPKDATRY